MSLITNFLTEHIVLDPIKNARGRMAWDCCDVIDHEVLTRLIAVTLVLPFALIDAGLCLGSGLVCHVIGIIDLCCNEDFTALEMAGDFYLRFLGFLVMAVAGPILGIINPDFLEDIRRVFLPSLNNSSLNSPPPGGASGNYLSSGAGLGTGAGSTYQVPASAPGSGLSAGVGYQAPSSGAGSGTGAGAANQQQPQPYVPGSQVQPQAGDFDAGAGFEDAPSAIKADLVGSLEGLSPADLRAAWAYNDLQQRHSLFMALRVDTAATRTLRADVGSTFFRALDASAYNWIERSVEWLSDEQVRERLNSDRSLVRPDPFVMGYPSFFHATKDIGKFRSILAAQSIWRLQFGAYPGAFVSTRPETGWYGRYVFCFHNIEYLSPLMAVGPATRPDYWAGFKHNIPLNKITLACVIIGEDRAQYSYTEPSQQEISDVERECHSALGFNVPVFSLQKARPYLDAIRRMRGIVIPREWPLQEGLVAPQQTLQLTKI